jgi:hypothetical protein
MKVPGRFGLLSALTSMVIVLVACGGSGNNGPVTPPGNSRLDVIVVGNGAVSSLPSGLDCSDTCGAPFATGSTVTLTATPAAGRQLAGWSGACSGAALTCTVTMDQARSATATFVATSATRFGLAVTLSGSGRVSSAPAGIDCGPTCQAQFNVGTQVTLTAVPAAGQVFDGWSGACRTQALTCDVTMTAARAVAAAFRPAPNQAGWGELVRLAGAGAATPLVAIDDAGRATAVWRQLDPGTTQHHVWSSRSTSGATWSTPERLENNAGNVSELRLSVDAVTGRGMLLWIQAGPTVDLHARPLDPSTGWGPAALVENIAGQVGVSSVGVDRNGNAVAVWSQIAPATRFSIHANRYTPGGGWGSPQLIETNEVVGSVDGDPIVTVTPAGDALTVWKRSGGGGDLWGNRFTLGAGWGTAAQIVADAGASQTIGRHDLALDATGNGMLVWGQLDIAGGAGNNAIWFKRFTGGSWQAGVSTVATAVANTQGFVSTPVLRMNAGGAAVVAWGDIDNSLRAAAATPQAVAFGSPATLRAAGSGPWDSLPVIGMNSAGGAMVAWVEPAGSNVTVSRLTPGAGWSAGEVVEPYPDPSYNPALAMNGSGHAVLGWGQFFPATGTQIVLRRWNAAP